MPCPMDAPFFTLMYTSSLCTGYHIAFPHHVFEIAGALKMMMFSKPLDWEYLCCAEVGRKYGGDECRVDWAFMLPHDFFGDQPMLFHQRKPQGGMLLAAMPIGAFSSVSVSGDGTTLVASL
ncbi:MAG: hypothetical protein HYW65_04190 [Candidatus Liptonbacteria bacterium]|nr:hypothetical protein [Candidatus Liptonbacteria bacterium]